MIVVVCFYQAMSLSRMVEGLGLHHEVLQEVMSSTETREHLLADIEELADRIKEVSIFSCCFKHNVNNNNTDAHFTPTETCACFC